MMKVSTPQTKSYLLKFLVVLALSASVFIGNSFIDVDKLGISVPNEVKTAIGPTEAYAATNGFVASGGYWYYYVNGTMMKSCWREINHSDRWDYYYFGSDGKMATGWLDWDGSFFYLAEGHGQDVGFYDPEYGTMRTGWQWIYHSSGWDEYYFWGNGSGRMATGWLDVGGHRFFLANSEVGLSYYSGDYGVCLKGLWRIGVYDYYFRAGYGEVGIDHYPTGAMLRSINYTEFFGRDGLLVYAQIDQYGHVKIYGIKSIPPEDPEVTIDLNQVGTRVLDFEIRDKVGGDAVGAIDDIGTSADSANELLEGVN